MSYLMKLETQVKRKGDSTVPWGTQMLQIGRSDTQCRNLTNCVLPVRLLTLGNRGATTPRLSRRTRGARKVECKNQKKMKQEPQLQLVNPQADGCLS